MAVDFRESLNQVQKRDEEEVANKPLPEATGVSPWVILGFALGVGAIIFSFIFTYDIIIGVVAVALSVVGYYKQKGNLAMAAMIVSGIGLVFAIVNTIVMHACVS